MFSKVLIGVDGVQGGRDAAVLAAQLAQEDAMTWLVHVFGAGLMPGRGSELLLSLEFEQSRALLERERETVAPATELISCADRSVGHALHVLAERREADLIVIGACRHGFLGRVLLGDDTISALNGAPCAVAIAPPGYADHVHPFAMLGVGYDGSPESEQALAAARGLAPRWGAAIKALSVISLQSIPYGEPVGQMVRGLAGVEADVAYGDPSKELVAFSGQVDLMIVGSRGYGPTGRLIHGSTSNQLARRAFSPLLVVPRSIPSGRHHKWDLPFEVVLSEGGGGADQVSTRP